jgi:hypothetical protein
MSPAQLALVIAVTCSTSTALAAPTPPTAAQNIVADVRRRHEGGALYNRRVAARFAAKSASGARDADIERQLQAQLVNMKATVSCRENMCRVQATLPADADPTDVLIAIGVPGCAIPLLESPDAAGVFSAYLDCTP